MERPDDEGEVYDSWGNHPGRHRVSIGAVNAGATKLLWWILGMVAVAGVAEAGWLGNAVVDLKAEVAALNAKMDFVIADRRSNGRP